MIENKVFKRQGARLSRRNVLMGTINWGKVNWDEKPQDGKENYSNPGWRWVFNGL